MKGKWFSLSEEGKKEAQRQFKIVQIKNFLVITIPGKGYITIPKNTKTQYFFMGEIWEKEDKKI